MHILDVSHLELPSRLDYLAAILSIGGLALGYFCKEKLFYEKYFSDIIARRLGPLTGLKYILGPYPWVVFQR